LRLELTAWDARFWRLAWPTTPYARFCLEAAATAEGPYTALGELTSDFGLAEWLVPVERSPGRFFRVLALEGR